MYINNYILIISFLKFF